jgi:hypothetical protein
MRLLSVGNPKTIKGQKKGFFTTVLHLAPSTLSGFNTCPSASLGCEASCLNTAGRGGIIKRGETSNAIQRARITRTKMFFQDRTAFMGQLVKEIEASIRQGHRKGLEPVFRLNATSDIRWENQKAIRDGKAFRNVFEAFPLIQFYDYTKLPNRRNLPPNYSLTFSLSESNGPEARLAILDGLNVAVVFRDSLPEAFQIGNQVYPVFNGDETDLRFLDPKLCVIGLKAKGKAKRDLSGFVYGPGETIARGSTLETQTLRQVSRFAC